MTSPIEPLISVIIVNRNRADLLRESLAHIYRVERPGPMEVIVVDNGSSDDSVKMVREEFPGTQIIEAKRNLGFARANNLAAATAGGRFLLLVNSDAMLGRDSVKRLAELMLKEPEAGMAGAQLLNEDGSLQTSFEAAPSLATEVLNRSLLKRLFPSRYPSKRAKPENPICAPALIGAVIMIRKKAWDLLGGFDEDYFFFLEETDLATRMVDAGFKVMFHPKAKATHLHGATASGHKSSARIEFYRSRYLFFAKRYGPVHRWALVSAMVFNLFLNMLYLAPAKLVTLGMNQKINDRLKVRYDLLKWHLKGQPQDWGLPRD
jgi:hypothetical protein